MHPGGRPGSSLFFILNFSILLLPQRFISVTPFSPEHSLMSPAGTGGVLSPECFSNAEPAQISSICLYALKMYHSKKQEGGVGKGHPGNKIH